MFFHLCVLCVLSSLCPLRLKKRIQNNGKLSTNALSLVSFSFIPLILFLNLCANKIFEKITQ